MKNLKKEHNLTRQNEKNVQHSQKHDANLQKNSTLFFQIGLILCLLAVYGALEMRFESENLAIKTDPVEVEFEAYTLDQKKYVIEQAVETDEPQQKEQPKEIIKIDKVPDDTDEKEITKKIVTETVVKTKPKNLNPNDFTVDKPDEEIEKFIDVNLVEQVPIYPGCERETTNDGRKKCLSDKLSKLVRKKFDAGLGSELGLNEGIQKIYVNFRIDKTGNVQILNTRAPHKLLEEEAQRVVNQIPQMQPGKQRGEEVSVLYTLPILFKVQN